MTETFFQFTKCMIDSSQSSIFIRYVPVFHSSSFILFMYVGVLSKSHADCKYCFYGIDMYDRWRETNIRKYDTLDRP